MRSAQGPEWKWHSTDQERPCRSKEPKTIGLSTTADKWTSGELTTSPEPIYPELVHDGICDEPSSVHEAQTCDLLEGDDQPKKAPGDVWEEMDLMSTSDGVSEDGEKVYGDDGEEEEYDVIGRLLALDDGIRMRERSNSWAHTERPVW